MGGWVSKILIILQRHWLQNVYEKNEGKGLWCKVVNQKHIEPVLMKD